MNAPSRDKTGSTVPSTGEAAEPQGQSLFLTTQNDEKPPGWMSFHDIISGGAGVPARQNNQDNQGEFEEVCLGDGKDIFVLIDEESSKSDRDDDPENQMMSPKRRESKKKPSPSSGKQDPSRPFCQTRKFMISSVVIVVLVVVVGTVAAVVGAGGGGGSSTSANKQGGVSPTESPCQSPSEEPVVSSTGPQTSSTTGATSSGQTSSSTDTSKPQAECLAGVLEEEDYIDWGFGTDLRGADFDLYSRPNQCLKMDEAVFPTREEQYHGCLAMCSMIRNCVGVTLVNNGFARLATPACCAKRYGWTFVLDSAQDNNLWSGEVKRQEGPGCFPKRPGSRQLLNRDSRIVSRADDKADPICPNITALQDADKTLVYLGQGVDLSGHRGDIYLDQSQPSSRIRCIQLADDTTFNQLQACMALCIMIRDCTSITFVSEDYKDVPQCCVKGSTDWVANVNADQRLYSATIPANLPLIPTPSPV